MRNATLVAAIAVALSACSSEDNGIYVIDADGNASNEATITFGPVALGEQASRDLVLRNRGDEAVEVDVVAPDGSPFSVLDSARVSIGGGEDRRVALAFRPQAEGDALAALSVQPHSDGAQTATVHVRGLGYSKTCRVSPEVIDFGNVATGTQRIEMLEIANGSAFDWTIRLEPLPADAVAFALAEGVPGDRRVPAKSTLRIPVAFRPVSVGAFATKLTLQGPASCATIVELAGEAVEQVLTLEPERLDFGFVPEGSSAKRTLTVRNAGKVDRYLVGFRVTQPVSVNAFEVEMESPDLVVPARGSVQLTVRFAPKDSFAARGELVFAADDPKRPTVSVPLAGEGLGPRIEVEPASLDFGTWPVGTGPALSVTIRNVGTDHPGTTDDNLFLRAVPLTGANASEFAVVLPAGELPPAGLAAGESLTLPIRFTSASAGPKAAKLAIESSDPTGLVPDVMLSAAGIEGAPCDAEMSTTSLVFGSVNRGLTRELSAVIRNKSTGAGAPSCRVQLFGLSPATAADFSLPGGPRSIEIPPGESRSIPVTYAPTDAAPHAGALELYVGTTFPLPTSIALAGDGADECLYVTPDVRHVNAKVACSVSTSFTLANACTSPVTVDSFAIVAGSSAEVTLDPTTTIPVVIGPASEATLKARYLPSDAGADDARIAIRRTLDGRTVERYVGVHGVATALSTQTDLFVPRSRADILFVIANGASMVDKQASLATAMASFFAELTSLQVDYHLAVTPMGCANPTCDSGRFLPLDTSRPRVVTPTTPNAAQVFAANANVGTQGIYGDAILRTAALALSAPLLSGHNAGFLRDDARLLIILVSAAEEQDTSPLSSYEYFFRSLKPRGGSEAVSVSALIPTMALPPSGCLYSSSSAGQNTRVRELVTRMGGVYGEVCSPGTTLSRALQSGVGPQTRYPLSMVPDLTVADPINVQLDGFNFPPVGALGETRWSYNSVANAIDFAPLSAPEKGTSVAVWYRFVCQ